MKKRTLLYIAAAIVLFIGLFLGIGYNSLVNKDEKVKLTWSEVENTYQRRLDLIPNLVTVVKGISEFESGTLEEVTAARSRAQAALEPGAQPTEESMRRQMQLQDTLAASINRVIAVVEKYPTLRGTEAYRGLQTQLEGSERRIKVARQDFNAAVADYNVATRSLSTGLVAKIFGFRPKEGFKADAGADAAVEVKF